MRNKQAIKKAQKKYEASGVIIRKVIKLHTTHDADILAWFANVDNFNGKMKELIREQIKREV